MGPLGRRLLLALPLLAGGAAAWRTPTVHLVGDSTMADRADTAATPERGWGQALPAFLGGVRVANHAANGRSARSFLAEGRWERARLALRPGDWVLVQFGHNDQKREDPARFADARGDFARLLERFVDEARAAGATPVLLSPVVRRRFDPAGALLDTHGAYPAAAREVARARGVPFVDLERLTRALVAGAGPSASRAWFVHLPPGAHPAFPAGRADDTHLSAAGARAVAALAATALAAAVPSLAPHVRPEARAP